MNKFKKFLNNIRERRKTGAWKFLLCCAGFLALGAALGVISKYSDGGIEFIFQCKIRIVQDIVLFFFERLSNATSGITFWIFLGVVICRFTGNPWRAAAYVLLMCAGMIPAYYLFAELSGQYYHASYINFWGAFALFTPAMSLLSWYACGRGAFSWVLRIGILAVSVAGGYLIAGSFLNIFIGIAAFLMTFIGRKQAGEVKRLSDAGRFDENGG